ncbi:5-formyltetrahydrofolate cyclo-ligase [Trinickia caryophylli]|uniref:5-formyltetrahydrofolate cyclo-ligase n=1 Tax=Trinickia caryophylli TaxID=28094 RepID=A0A1X7FB68_TRICW|nr:5-formyltetrahydrofolate cyclo-ligase [Trinickia caryophylli]SMF49556.1 5,10-methenyltetrahydrofolate synthetase [Trinickia caryophylli]
MSESIACNAAANSKAELRKALRDVRHRAAATIGANDALAARLDSVLARLSPLSVGFYWPLPGEFDARDALVAWLAGDARRQAALPVIAVKGQALAFHAWSPDTPMRMGHHRIPEPLDTPAVLPDLLLVPCVGFDDAGYRLGYGGGYYDRTLAAWPGPSQPITVGIAYEACRIEALAHEPHDRPLDGIVTEVATRLRERA